MIANLKLRSVTHDDVPALHQCCWPESTLHEISMRIRSVVEQNPQRTRVWGIVAEVEGKVVGYGQLTKWSWNGEICNLVVTELWRGKGVGTMIIRRLIGLARENALREVEIGAAETNPRALALYRRLGFRHARTVFFDVGNGPEPVEYLVLSIGRPLCE